MISSWDCLLWAAVLRAGPRAVLSHQTAARLWGLPAAESSLIHVSVPSGSPAPRIPGVIVHYSSRGPQAHHPVLAPPRTTVEATVLDVASTAASAEEAIAWVLGAIASRRTTAERVAAVLRRRDRMRWRSEILPALDPMNSGVHSILEYRFVTRVERPHGLPAGTRQRPVVRGLRKEYSDVAYDDYATLVELDGRAAHPEDLRRLDTKRDNANIADGRVTLRYGWTEVNKRSCEIAGQLASTLRGRGWSGWPRRCGPACRIPLSLLTHQPARARRRPPPAG
jgi:PAS domain-containing protein